MKCTRCRKPAQIRLPSHNSKFCADCFDLFFQNAVRTGLRKVGFPADSALAVAVSGGKDSLACWDVLARLGYRTLGVHIDLAIDGFSEASREAVTAFARDRGLEYKIFELKKIFGYLLPDIRRSTRREVCSSCGTIKRSFLNRLAVEEGYTAVATGHHLDDETGRLMGNLIRHKEQYLERFYPYLPSAHPRQAARIKPLYRVDQVEIRAYCRQRGIRPVEGPGCPYSKGATSHYFQEAMHFLEEKMPGTKRDFLYTHLKDRRPPEGDTFKDCLGCGQPAYGEFCGVCRLKAQLDGKAAPAI